MLRKAAGETIAQLELRDPYIVCSPRKRAVVTAELAGLTVDEVNPLVTEWDYGDYEGTTTEDRNAESAQMMVDSQQEATAAALTELGYDVGARISVHSILEDSAAEGVLEENDVIIAADGEPATDAAALRKIVNDAGGAPVELLIDRDGEEQTVSITPKETEVDGEKTLLLGVNLITDYDFPIDVTIQLNNVGGPSAGMMFALGIIDTLTPDQLNGGQNVAGTGTITADGEVGPIGGIRQKLFGAKDAGAEWFLAPEANCDEVVGHVPDGLQVFAVETLDDALNALEAVRDGLWLAVNGQTGTARAARVDGFDVAGKTGTAQVISLDAAKALAGKTDRDLRHHGWFVFFAPKENPEIAGVVFTEHGGTSAVSTPIARHVIETYVAKRNGKPLPVLARS